MESLEERAAKTLQDYAEEYRRAGFEVFVEPRGENVPEFLRGFEPDLVATSSSKGNFVIEVKASKPVEPGAWKRLAKVVESEPGWHFELILVAPEGEFATNRENRSSEAVEQMLAEASTLAEQKHLNAAVLVGWAAFESAARHQLAALGSDVKAVPPQTLIKQLVHLGVLAQSDVAMLSEISRKRNAVAHGFAATVDARDVETLVIASRQLLMLGSASPGL